jgi:tRNA-specific 2-thiouridylase
VRYRHEGEPALVVGAQAAPRVLFDGPVRAVTPGQVAVLYDDSDRVLGGGRIRAIATGEAPATHADARATC